VHLGVTVSNYVESILVILIFFVPTSVWGANNGQMAHVVEPFNTESDIFFLSQPGDFTAASHFAIRIHLHPDIYILTFVVCGGVIAFYNVSTPRAFDLDLVTDVIIDNRFVVGTSAADVITTLLATRHTWLKLATEVAHNLLLLTFGIALARVALAVLKF